MLVTVHFAPSALNPAKQWQTKWFSSLDDARSFAREITPKAWGVEVTKVNRANKQYTHGATVRWYWRPGVQPNVTDRAKRYRAQQNVKGPKRCVLCCSTKDLGVMHLDGDESHGEARNLAWGCRACNQILSHGFKRAGLGKRTKQYNPSAGVPSFEQYCWAVAHHSREAHDEGGAIIHATPKSKRIEYASRIAGLKAERGTGRTSEVPF
jgi:hypothetical protein